MNGYELKYELLKIKMNKPKSFMIATNDPSLREMIFTYLFKYFNPKSTNVMDVKSIIRDSKIEKLLSNKSKPKTQYYLIDDNHPFSIANPTYRDIPKHIESFYSEIYNENVVIIYYIDNYKSGNLPFRLTAKLDCVLNVISEGKTQYLKNRFI